MDTAKRGDISGRSLTRVGFLFFFLSEMAEQKAFSVGNGQSAQSGLGVSPAGAPGALQDGLSFALLDGNGDEVVQPFPRSPKLQRKVANAGQPSQVSARVSNAVQHDRGISREQYKNNRSRASR